MEQNTDPDAEHVFLDAKVKESSLDSQEQYTKDAWETSPNLKALLNMSTPTMLETPCCASFIVHRDRILARERHVYESLWQWLIDTPMHNRDSGRVLEYTWHVLFGESPRIGALNDQKLARQCTENNNGTRQHLQGDILNDPIPPKRSGKDTWYSGDE
jgi:hypothetical protein